jgi:hypothetical protein
VFGGASVEIHVMFKCTMVKFQKLMQHLLNNPVARRCDYQRCRPRHHVADDQEHEGKFFPAEHEMILSRRIVIRWAMARKHPI